MKMYVTNKACPGCPFTPDRLISDKEARNLVEWCLSDEEAGHVPECQSVTIAVRKKYSWELPFPSGALVCCFAFFYCYGRQHLYLRAAIEQGIIEYVDISGWESLEESGFLLRIPTWEKGPQTAELAVWGREVCAKSGIAWERKVEPS